MKPLPADSRDLERTHRLPIATAGEEQRAPDESGIRVATGSPHREALSRHPADGHRLARPYPMSQGTRRAFRALIVALCPPSPAPQFPDLTDRVEQGARRFITYMHPVVAWVMAVGIVLLDLLPVLSLARSQRLFRLAPEDAASYLRDLAHTRFTPLRTLIAGIRGLVLSVYFDQSEVHAALGYAPVPFIRERMVKRHSLMKSTPSGRRS